MSLNFCLRPTTSLPTISYTHICHLWYIISNQESTETFSAGWFCRYPYDTNNKTTPIISFMTFHINVCFCSWFMKKKNTINSMPTYCFNRAFQYIPVIYLSIATQSRWKLYLFSVEYNPDEQPKYSKILSIIQNFHKQVYIHL